MANESNFDRATAGTPTSTGAGSIGLAVATSVILGVVFYGLNNRTPPAPQAAAPAQTTSATKPAPQASKAMRYSRRW
jgi:hypothetical protein